MTPIYKYITPWPTHSVTTNGPYGQFLRLRRICTLDSDYQIHGQSLIKFYQDRGYPQKPLQAHYKRAARFTQDDLLDTKKQKGQKIKESPGYGHQIQPKKPQYK